MKHIFIFLTILTTFASCRYTTGSGNIITNKRNVGNFNGISVGGAFEVEVRTGPVTEVTVEADDNIMQYIETRVSGNILKIRTEGLHNYSNVHMKVYITTTGLSSIRTSASADVRVMDILTGSNRLSFHASSSGSIEADIDAPEAEADASSGGTISLRGKTRFYNAQASSGASIKSYDLLSEDTKVQVSSGGTARVHASVSLNAQASSGGSINYVGGGTVTKSESSGGSINRKD